MCGGCAAGSLPPASAAPAASVTLAADSSSTGARLRPAAAFSSVAAWRSCLLVASSRDLRACHAPVTLLLLKKDAANFIVNLFVNLFLCIYMQ